jgi:MFS family permease
MQSELMNAFNITAAEFGRLGGFYFCTYALMQIPAGMLYDKFGPRMVLFFACLTAVLGLTVFVAADSFMLAACGRLLIGLGGAFAYIGSLKLASIWLAPNRFATAAGLTTACGIASGALSQHYLTAVIQNVGYQQALQSAIPIGVMLSCLILLLVRNNAQGLSKQQPLLNRRHMLSSLKYILSKRQMWLLGLVSCCTYLPAPAFLDLWGIPYLRTAYHLSPHLAATVISFAFIGWMCAGPIVGILSDKIKQRRLIILLASLMSATIFSCICYVPNLNISLLRVMFFLLGISCAGHTLCYAMGKESNPLPIAGTAIAVTNTISMSSGALVQPLIGMLLDWHASHSQHLLGSYDAYDYVFALSIIPVGIILGSLLSLFLKDTYNNQS